MAYDANFSSVVLLLHGDGANGSKTFTDSSPSPKVPSSVGGSKIDTGFTPFTTGGSIKLPLSTPLVYAGQVAFNVNITSWTIEMWAYELPTSLGTLVSRRANASSVGWVLTTSSVRAIVNGAGFEGQQSWTRPSFNSWHHYALVKDGTELRVYVDGALVSTKTGVTSLSDGGGNVNFGQSDQASENRFDGYIDEVRWTSGVARYTADFTPPTEVFPNTDHEVAISTAALPSMLSSASSGASSPVSLPKMLFYGGLAVQASSEIPIPAMLVSSGSGASVQASLPTLSAYSTAHDNYGEQGVGAGLPSLTLSGSGGAGSVVEMPSISVSATATSTVQANVGAVLPKMSAIATGRAAATANITVSLPKFSAASYAGALCSITIGSVTTQAIGTMGGIGGVKVTLPLFIASAIGAQQAHGGASITLPSLGLVTGASVVAMLPSLNLLAIGTAVVAVTYDAYAVNLKHSDPNANDETTHYTNFPFTHVVRYQNSYYGANSTGLYLLEGTTDNGTPIPWAFETAITDFKSPNKKTLAAAYFSGRFGTSSTIQLKKGEKSPITHAFTTPRGTLAQNHRQVFGKDRAETRTRYFALAASGTSEFELDAIECDVHNTTRRI